MKKDNFIKGILVGVIITLMLMMFMGFGGGGLGSSRTKPMYVKIVN
tara:strand:- start:22 stop:159 length:138 start_codon:yes stop_codon:yes gene_type:complete